MTDFTKILDKAKELEAKMKESQEKIKEIKAEGVSGSNSVKITLDGEGEMQKIELSDEIIKEDKSIIEDLIVADYNLVKEGTIGALDIPYILQDTIGRVASVKAAIGLGGGAWKDYVNSSQQLMMSLKMTGDTPEDLEEIYNAYIAWANAQQRFTSVKSFEGGMLYIGDTNVWISNDSTYVRMLLTQDLEIFNEITTQISRF